MPYCSKCGKETTKEDVFCPACGQRQRDGGKPTQSQKSSGTRPVQHEQENQDVEMYLTISTILFVTLAVLSLLMGDAMGVALSGGLAVAMYFLALKRFKEKDLEYPKIVCLFSAAIAAILGLTVLFSGNIMIGLVNCGVAIPPFLAWQKMQEQT